MIPKDKITVNKKNIKKIKTKYKEKTKNQKVNET